MWEIPFKLKGFFVWLVGDQLFIFYGEADQTPEQVAKRSCGLLILESPGKPTLIDPAFRSGVKLDYLQRSVPASTIL